MVSLSPFGRLRIPFDKLRVIMLSLLNHGEPVEPSSFGTHRMNDEVKRDDL
jgi:hypothetical protein